MAGAGVLVALCVASVAYHGGVRVTAAFAPAPAAPAPDPSAPLDATGTADQRVDLALIVDMGFFGQSDAAESQNSFDDAEAPLGPVSDYRLLGVIVGATPDQSRAMLAVGADIATVAVGDRLDTGDEVAEITPGRVLLLRDGADIAIAFPEPAPVDAPLADIADTTGDDADADLADADQPVFELDPGLDPEMTDIGND